VQHLLWAPYAFGAWVGVWSLVALSVFWGDKRRAIGGVRRIPERTLLWLCVIGGAPGGWFAMSRLRHKTRHRRFRILVPFLAILWSLLVGFVFWRSWQAG
jgi:uncharacterized membrane protein YsdA (DUF1294 family)